MAVKCQNPEIPPLSDIPKRPVQGLKDTSNRFDSHAQYVSNTVVDLPSIRAETREIDHKHSAPKHANL